MGNRNQTLTIVVVLLVTALVIGGLVWVNIQFAQNNPGGNDFLAHYVGTRALLFEGKSPYSDDVALEIQNRVFGRPAEPGEIEHRVVYPLYSIVIFAPFALIENYAIARVAWMTVMELALIGTGYLALRITNWKPKLIVLAFYFQFSILWYHGFRAVINGNAVIVVSLFIAGALYAILKDSQAAAGILLALSTIKPNLVLLFILYVLIWCAYQKRYQVLVWFFGSLFLLTAGGMVLIPDWIIQNLREIIRYPGYNPPGSVGEVLGFWFPEFALVIRVLIAGSLGSLLVIEGWQARKGHWGHFLWGACLTLVISQWIGIATDPGNFVILFIPFVLILAHVDDRWEEHSTYLILGILGITLVGLWVLFVATLDYDYQPMQSSIMFFPFPGLALVGLYWIKWWVVGKHATFRQGYL